MVATNTEIAATDAFFIRYERAEKGDDSPVIAGNIGAAGNGTRDGVAGALRQNRRSLRPQPKEPLGMEELPHR